MFFMGWCWIIPDFTGFYRVNVGYTMFLWVSNGLYLVLLGFTGLQWVMLRLLWVSNGLHLVLLGFIGF